MAIYHCSASIISRSKGQSSVASAAYRAGERLVDERTGEIHDYSRKTDVSYSEIFAPKGAPDWVHDREVLWNKVEAAEKRKDSQLSREFTVALPRELTKEQNIALTKELADAMFVSKGMVVDVNIHNIDGQNPHVHFMATTRHLTEDGFGKKNRDWNGRDMLVEQRKIVSEFSNNHLQCAGHNVSISEQSLKDRGIPLKPNIHLGPELHAAMVRGEGSPYEKVNQYLETMETNGNKIIENPEIALKKICQQQATFNDYDIAKIANQHSSDLEQFHKVKDAIANSSSLVKLGTDNFNNPVYSSAQTIKTEKAMLDAAYELQAKQGHGVEPEVANKALKETLGDKELTPSQAKAFPYLMDKGDLKVVVGLAGTGKSFLMKACKDAWLSAGYDVKGGSLSGKATEGLQEGTITEKDHVGIQSRTLDSWLHRWDEGRDLLNKKDIFVVDEGGMVDTEKFKRALDYINDAGAKTVVITDPEQTQPFAAGNPTRSLVNRMEHVKLTEVFRQKDKEMQKATIDFGEGRAKDALARYDKMGCIKKGFTNRSEAKQQMVADWSELRLQRDQIMMAHENKDVNDLNKMARDVLIESGEMDNGKTYQVNNRDGMTRRNFASNDRIYFLENRELGGVEVKNGSLGTIQNIKKDKFEVLLDGKNQQVVNFDLKDYKSFDHGYAATISKAQGVTKGGALLLGSKYMDGNLTYVGCTRHEYSFTCYSNKEDFKTDKEFYDTMCRENGKTMAIDFAERHGVTPDYTGYDPYVPRPSEQNLALNRIAEKALEVTAGLKCTIANTWDSFKGMVGSVVQLVDGRQMLEIHQGNESTLVNYNSDVAELKGRQVDIETNSLGEMQKCEFTVDDRNNKVDILDSYAKEDIEYYKAMEAGRVAEGWDVPPPGVETPEFTDQELMRMEQNFENNMQEYEQSKEQDIGDDFEIGRF